MNKLLSRRALTVIAAILLALLLVPAVAAGEPAEGALPLTEADTARAAELAAEDGALAAEYINAYEDTASFERLVRTALDAYYGGGANKARRSAPEGTLAQFEAAIDSRAATILQNYAEAASERATAPTELGYSPERIIAVFDAEYYASRGTAALSAVRGTELCTLDAGESVIAFIAPSLEDTVERAIDRLSEQRGILSAEPDYIYRLPAEEAASPQAAPIELDYHQETVLAPEAWDILSVIPAEKTRVVVIDTGCDMDHEDLAANLNAGLSRDFVNFTGEGNSGPLLADSGEHGTHVSGIIAATNNNGIGTVGIATGNDNSLVELVVCNVFVYDEVEEDLVAYNSDTLAALDYAVSIGAKVVNLSLGGTGDGGWSAAIQHAVEEGCVVVAAAGNEATDDAVMNFYPSDAEAAISVISIDETYARSWFSNYGECKDISAPGSYIYSTVPYNAMDLSEYKYGYMSGTSMASPVAAGVTSLIWSVLPDAEPAMVRAILEATCLDIVDNEGNVDKPRGDVYTVGYDKYTGYGCVDAKAAVSLAVMSESGTPAVSATSTSEGVQLTISGTSSAYSSIMTLALYSSVDGGNYELLTELSGSATAYTDSAVSTGKLYSYMVVQNVTGGSGEEYYFNSSTPVTLPCLAAPAAPTVELQAGGCRLSGYAVANAQGYDIFRAPVTSGEPSYTLLTHTENAVCVDASVETGRVYSYRVKAYAANGAAVSPFGAATRIAYIQVPSPKAAADGEKLQVTWSAATGSVSGYRLSRSVDGGAFSTLATLPATASSYADRAITTGSLYSYRLEVAYTLEGGTDEYTPVGGASEGARLLPAPQLWATTGTGGNFVNIGSIAIASGYELYRAEGDGAFALLCSVSGSYTDESAEAGVSYRYRARAYHTLADGVRSLGVMSAESEAIYVPAPASISATLENGVARISWEGVSGASSYNIYAATSVMGVYTFIGSSESTSFELETESASFYRVAAVIDGLESELSGAAETAEERSPFAVTVDLSGISSTREIWIDGVRYSGDSVEADGTRRTVTLENGSAKTLIIYSYNSATETDKHKLYPTGMRVWLLSYANGAYTATRASEFDNILMYAGSSIRITGTKGIRMITSVPTTKKRSLTSSGLRGYTLVEYGTAVAWANEMGANPLVLGRSYTKSAQAYKKGVSDPIYKTTSTMTQYTNVLVGFSNAQCVPDLAMRPYMILQNAAGNRITLYGGVIERSIGYIAYQNKTAFKAKTASYNYIWSIIRYVYGATATGETE